MATAKVENVVIVQEVRDDVVVLTLTRAEAAAMSWVAFQAQPHKSSNLSEYVSLDEQIALADIHKALNSTEVTG